MSATEGMSEEAEEDFVFLFSRALLAKLLWAGWSCTTGCCAYTGCSVRTRVEPRGRGYAVFSHRAQLPEPVGLPVSMGGTSV